MKEKKIIRDGHIHSPYCPHGSKDPFHMYIDKAIDMGLEEITFTEHMPFPMVFMDEEILKECSPSEEEIKQYFNELLELKKTYSEKIKINIGLEVDYIEGYEKETKDFLDKYGNRLDDAILSVHFLKIGDDYYAMDYSVDVFGELVEKLGGVKEVYDKYFETVLKSITADLGTYKPRRIGHPTLVRLFNKKYPIDYDNVQLLEEIAKEIKERGYEIDFNTAGLRKEYCLEPYPSGKFNELVTKYNIRKVYGSDSHISSDVGKSFDNY